MKLYFFFPSTEVIRFLIITPPLREISRFSPRYPHKTRTALPACHCDLPSITMCIAALAFDYSSVTRLHFGQLIETDQLLQFCCCDTACVSTNNVWSNFLNMLRWWTASQIHHHGDSMNEITRFITSGHLIWYDKINDHIVMECRM